ncbi:Cytochrome c oxidase cbb3-type subunit 4 OS=Castellaniella defragrans OX=75697 GN=HNR28_000837 PE=4 SV=1 [Castellaniella defragrans]
MLGFVNGMMTLVSLATFIGIVGWAWSAHRAEANRQSALLPFALPEEYQDDESAGGPSNE